MVPASKLWIGMAIVALQLNACGRSEQSVVDNTPEVGIYVVKEEDIIRQAELPGRTRPYRIAEVRPQIDGIIHHRLFEEGSYVKQGQQLYQIDPAMYQTAFERSNATLYSTNALLNRYQDLQASNSISRQQYDDALANKRLAAAEVEAARINLQYTKVFSPISGRIGRSTVTEGALVLNGQQQAMATIQQLDPIYVDITQAMSDVLRLRKKLDTGMIKNADADKAVVRLQLEDGSVYPLAGKLHFSEVSVDESTGSVTMRATFPNPQAKLLPGMFVHAQLEEGVVKNGKLVPQQAVTRNLRGQAIVMIVKNDMTVEERIIEVDGTVGNAWLLHAGLNSGDRVVTEGLQLVRSGIKVKPMHASNVKLVNAYSNAVAER